MAATNTAKWEEGTEIALDSEVEAPAAGWTITYASVNRVGNLVAVHIEATFGDSAAAPVCTLQSEFRPAATVKTPDGKFTVGTDGVVSYTGSTTTGAAAAPCQLVFQAGDAV